MSTRVLRSNGDIVEFRLDGTIIYNGTHELVKKEIAMSKFKVGQKVYCIRRGLGEVYGKDRYLAGDVVFLIKFPEKDNCEYTFEGKLYHSDLNPTLLTLEEARAKGYDVPKQKIVKEKTVYINLYSNTNVPYAHENIEAAEAGAKNGDGNLSKYVLAKAYPVTIKYEIEE